MKKKKRYNRLTFDRTADNNKEDLTQLEIKLSKKVDKETGKVSYTAKKIRSRKPSKFRDGQILDNKTLIRRMLNGSIVDKMTEGQYYGGDHDSIDIEAVERMDIVDQVEMMEENQNFLEDTYKELQSEVEKRKEKETKALKEKEERNRKIDEVIKKDSKESE